MRRKNYRGYRESGHTRRFSLAAALGLVFYWDFESEDNPCDVPPSTTRAFHLTRICRWALKLELTR